MAWSLAEVQAAATAAKATYFKLLATPESQRTMEGRAVTQKDLDGMRKQIEELHELERLLLDGGKSAPGVAYAQFLPSR